MFKYDFVPGNTAPGDSVSVSVTITVSISVCVCISMARQPRQEELRSNHMTRILLVWHGNPTCPQGSRPTHTQLGHEVGPVWAHTDGVACHSLSHGR